MKCNQCRYGDFHACPLNRNPSINALGERDSPRCSLPPEQLELPFEVGEEKKDGLRYKVSLQPAH
jgi:hypothetical protein